MDGFVDKSDLHEELRDRFGILIELLRRIEEHLQLQKKNLRYLNRLIESIDHEIEFEYLHKRIPKIIKNRIRRTDDALYEAGFKKTFQKYEDWPWEYNYED
jgi:hypothetical protein